MIQVRDMRKGDRVRLLVGDYAGIDAVVHRVMPKDMVVASRIQVQFDMMRQVQWYKTNTGRDVRSDLVQMSNRWWSATDWEVILRANELGRVKAF